MDMPQSVDMIKGEGVLGKPVGQRGGPPGDRTRNPRIKRHSRLVSLLSTGDITLRQSEPSVSLDTICCTSGVECPSPCPHPVPMRLAEKNWHNRADRLATVPENPRAVTDSLLV
jgi:hypothetical protein